MTTALGAADCVGALIRDRDNRVYLQRRSLERRQLPGAWDIVGGHVEPGETPEAALAREVTEETGWRLRRIEAVIADWEWMHNGTTQRELDYLIEVSGDLSSPKLEPGKHDKSCWVGYDNPDRVRSEYDAGNDALWNIVKRATRIRLTSDLHLEPISATSAETLLQLCRDGLMTLDVDPLQEAEILAVATGLERLWDSGDGYSWAAYWRGAQSSAIGYAGLTRGRSSPAREFMLHCAVSAGEQFADTAAEIVKAALSFARNEFDADQVFARISLCNPWAADVARSSGMRPAGPNGPDDRSAETFVIRFKDNSSYDLDHDVVTGVGQIMAVPT